MRSLIPQLNPNTKSVSQTPHHTPDSLGALSVGELNSPRVAPLPIP
ncbi:hypothetical protein BJP36_40150 [Moorena producens JHB]|uniref:Uncharacterized protein n=1 Tax=Moorena producens (strain JHB) TaxID=1454205 RepID=A0A9Q9SS11_MOOP1|nr:hypothetical protein [Moorena producens]WAN68590.1 hypothetical protein BJP36_40150 [Moorena producens JHB]